MSTNDISIMYTRNKQMISQFNAMYNEKKRHYYLTDDTPVEHN